MAAPKKLTDRLFEYRQRRRLTQAQLAYRSKMTTLRYWQIENGERPATDADLIKIARVLKVRPRHLDRRPSFLKESHV